MSVITYQFYLKQTVQQLKSHQNCSESHRCILLGLVVALIYIFFKVIFDKRIKDEEDVEKELGLPVLGSIQKFN